jgi:hypothetical protein
LDSVEIPVDRLLMFRRHQSDLNNKGHLVNTRSYISLSIFALVTVMTCRAVEPITVPVGSKIYVSPEGGFDTFLTAALNKKHVQVIVVADRAKADFVLEALSQSEKAGWARTVFLAQTGSNEEASVKLVNVKTSEVVFAYAVHKRNSVHGKQSSAEACAKHLREVVR